MYTNHKIFVLIRFDICEYEKPDILSLNGKNKRVIWKGINSSENA